MKTSIKKTTLFFVLLAVLGLAACTDTAKTAGTADSAQTAAAGDHAHTYACPMHPEVTGKEGDKCPKCGMALEHNDNAGNNTPYTMLFKSDPARLEAGKAALLSFSPAIKGRDGEAVPLDVEHEKKMHLIVVSNDLAYFDHIHPEYQASGSYDISVVPAGKPYTKHSNQTRFDKGGAYTLFADYLPTGANHQLEKIGLDVGGPAYVPATFTESKLTATLQDGYAMTLVPDGGKFESGGPARIRGTVMHNGKELPADQLENYLGAKAHVVVVGMADKDYLHVHPGVEAGKLDLQTSFAKPGIYRAWAQFQAQGKVYTADFTLNVTQGAAAQAESHAGHGDH